MKSKQINLKTLENNSPKKISGHADFAGSGLTHGGVLRNRRKGRSMRPLSTKQPAHLVFKINRSALKKGLRHPKNFTLVSQLFKTYGKHFFIRIEQLSIQNDHIHCLIRAPKRQLYLNFFRVVTGQIAQRLQVVTDTPTDKAGAAGARNNPKQRHVNLPNMKLWKHRPFSRVVRGLRAYKIVRNYIQLNEQEALGIIRYNKNRLKGLSSFEWQLLWS